MQIKLGIASFLLGFFYLACGRYSEGKGKLINRGNKLIYWKLCPREFIYEYEMMRDCSDNIISKPDFDVLRLLVVAYDALGDTEHELATLDEMLAISPAKKKSYVRLLKSSVPFSVGRTEEAECIFNEVQNEKMNVLTKMTADTVLKSDRAIALGDFSIAETYHKQILARSFPKNTPLVILYSHFSLAKIYSKTKHFEKANVHLNYCVENGGDTALKAEAENMLKE